jgi:glycosyltransferase involved in cell wall biosynthesis
MDDKRLLSVISPCYNEEDNVDELYRRICDVFSTYPQYDFEYLFIDNASTDGTVERLKALAAKDKRVKIIVNTRNFGHIRSPYWGLIQTSGEASIYLASDLQDPPELIPKFLEAWSQGYKIVLATKPVSHGSVAIHRLRKGYYLLLDNISNVSLAKDAFEILSNRR